MQSHGVHIMPQICIRAEETSFHMDFVSISKCSSREFGVVSKTRPSFRLLAARRGLNCPRSPVPVT